MAERGDRDANPGQNIEHVRIRNDLRFDARRCKQRVEHHAALRLVRGGQPAGSQPTGGLLLHDGGHTVAEGVEIADGQPTDQRPLNTEAVEIARDAVERGIDPAQRPVRGHVPGRPHASPCSAPGRSWSHASRRASISAAESPGCSRRSRSRIIASPVSNSSRARRSRRAASSRSCRTRPILPDGGLEGPSKPPKFALGSAPAKPWRSSIAAPRRRLLEASPRAQALGR